MNIEQLKTYKEGANLPSPKEQFKTLLKEFGTTLKFELITKGIFDTSTSFDLGGKPFRFMGYSYLKKL